MRRHVLIYVLLAGLPVLAALPNTMTDFDSWEDQILSDAYSDELAATNHGKQAVVQLSEHALQDIVVHELVELDAVVFEGATAWPMYDESGPVYVSFEDLDYHFWVRDVVVTVLDDQQIEIVLDTEGWIVEADVDLSEDAVIGGPLVYTADLEIVQDDSLISLALDGDLDWDAFDAGPLQDDYLWSKVLPELDMKVDGWLDQLPEIPLYDTDTFGLDDMGTHLNGLDGSVVAGVDYRLTYGVQGVDFKTVADPVDDGEPFLMIGFDLASLPDCHEAAAEAGDYDLFHDEAWAAFEGNLIEPGRDMGVSVSTRLLRRLLWNAAFMTHQDGPTGLEQLAVAKEAAEPYGSVTKTLYTRWGGFEGDDPIADSENAMCDGEGEGSFVLEVDDFQNPWFELKAWLHVDHFLWFDSSGGMYGGGRLYVESEQAGRPTLYVDLYAETEYNPTSLLAIPGGFGCNLDEDVEAGVDSLTTVMESITATAMAQLLTLHNLGEEGSDPPAIAYAMDHMRPHAATLSFSGRLSTSTLDAHVPAAWAPPVGTIAGMNHDEPDDPVLVDGYDPTERLCPPGWVSRAYTIDDEDLRWCEFADTTDGTDPSVLPEGAWCGLSVHDRHEPEACNGEDDDGDGLVDEDFVDGDDDGVAECLASLAAIDGPAHDAHESTCGTHDPRDSCPDGFTALPVWMDDDYAICLLEATGWRNTYSGYADVPVEVCPWDLEDEEVQATIREAADFVTCVADGSGYSDETVPSGLVLHGFLADFSDDSDAGRYADGCDEGLEWVKLDLSIGNNLIPLSVSWRGGYYANLSGVYGDLYYCATPTTDSDDDDADGLQNQVEDLEGTDAWDRSTDGDVLPDGFELSDDLTVEGVAVTLDPTALDTDGDGLDDFVELFVTWTWPDDSDTDDDGLPDGWEVWVSDTDPLDDDTDDDGILDGEEESLQDVDDDWYDGLKPEGDDEEAGEAEEAPDGLGGLGGGS